MYYSKYLQLDKILNSQTLESSKSGSPAHEEMLFIITHQTYELWFKQILFELDSIITAFDKDFIDEKSMLLVLSRMRRIETIFDLLIKQFKTIETMTPMDFLEFRNFLIPASGFQSLQFRKLSIRLGIPSEHSNRFYTQLSTDDRLELDKFRSTSNLFDLLNSWLSRMPFASSENFQFWKQYSSSVKKSMNSEREIVRKNTSISEKEIDLQLRQIDENEQYIFDTVNKDTYERQALENKDRRLRYESMISALFIILYRENPIFHMPYQIISSIVNIDTLLSEWLNKHISLVSKIVGSKIGTGGTSGAVYLGKSAQRHRIFRDFMNISTLIIRRSELPELPSYLKRSLKFNY